MFFPIIRDYNVFFQEKGWTETKGQYVSSIDKRVFKSLPIIFMQVFFCIEDSNKLSK